METQNAPAPATPSLPPETERLLLQYFDAFANLYGITPLSRALHIIQLQNPELELTEAQFLAFLDGFEPEYWRKRHYWIAGPEDLFDDVNETTPPLSRELLTEYLYALNDNSYLEMKAYQAGKPYYLPGKAELLKYADDRYYEQPPEYQALHDFLQNQLKLPDPESVVSDLQAELNTAPPDCASALRTLSRLSQKKRYLTVPLANEFCRYYLDAANHTRSHCNLGHTPAELHARPLSDAQAAASSDFYREPGSVEYAWDELHEILAPGFFLRTTLADILIQEPFVRVKKPGRNDPCPCGSGKKYKKCCGR